MSEKYIPTTDEVRDHYDPSCEPRFQDDSRLEEHIPAEFDRWLAEHDKRIRREALELTDEEADIALEAYQDDRYRHAYLSEQEAVAAIFTAVAKHREASDVCA